MRGSIGKISTTRERPRFCRVTIREKTEIQRIKAVSTEWDSLIDLQYILRKIPVFNQRIEPLEYHLLRDHNPGIGLDYIRNLKQEIV